MKKLKWVMSIALLILVSTIKAQASYEYIVVPERFFSFGEEKNPYNLSSNTRYLLKKKNFKVFNEGDKELSNVNICAGLTVTIEKVSTLLRNKLEVSFENCRKEKVFTSQGMGRSKEFKEGYTEALTQALKQFETMPQANISIGEQEITRFEEAIQPTANVQLTETLKEVNKKVLYNDTYMVRQTKKGEGKELHIMNHAAVGYSENQRIAVLKPTDLVGIYQVDWFSAEGAKIEGIAQETADELRISFTESQQKTIVLKYLND